MWNEPSKERLNKIPKLYETENVPLKDKLIYLHFFIGACDWYIAEFDGKDLFFGFAILNNDLEMAEWGYISLNELKSFDIKGIEIDCELPEFWSVKRAIKIDKIRIAQGWLGGYNSQQVISNISEPIMKVRAGHFQHFQDLFTEVTSQYSDFYGIDPYSVWEEAQEIQELKIREVKI